jgi:hypothetical protein
MLTFNSKGRYNNHVVKQSGVLGAVPQISVSCSNQPKSPLASQPIHQRYWCKVTKYQPCKTCGRSGA